MTYLVLDAWNVAIARFTDLAAATKCARATKGYVVFSKRGAV